MIDWTLPDGYAWDSDAASRCRSCRAEIRWARTPVGRSAPLNADGTSHFATCPDAASWRARKPKARP